MNFLRIFTLLAFISASLVSCKKGPDDPLLSLRTRKARLEGKWRLQTGKAYVTIVNLGKWERYNWAFTFKASRYDLTETGANDPVTSSGAYILNLDIKKDGSFSFSEQLMSNKIKATGHWNFLTKDEEHKNKERIMMEISTVSEGKLSNIHLFNQSNKAFDFHIKELRNKKLVIEGNAGIEADPDGYSYDFNVEYTFIPE